MASVIALGEGVLTGTDAWIFWTAALSWSSKMFSGVFEALSLSSASVMTSKHASNTAAPQSV